MILFFIGCFGQRPPQDNIATKQQEIIHQLTNFDIVLPICKPEYIAKNGNGLCRELTCLIFTRGIDSQTSGQTCETISNLNNTKAIIQQCQAEPTEATQSRCFDLYWRRK